MTKVRGSKQVNVGLSNLAFKIMANTDRKLGFYWVKLDDEWTVDEWCYDGWESDNIDETYEEIDENILTR